MLVRYTANTTSKTHRSVVVHTLKWNKGNKRPLYLFCLILKDNAFSQSYRLLNSLQYVNTTQLRMKFPPRKEHRPSSGSRTFSVQQIISNTTSGTRCVNNQWNSVSFATSDFPVRQSVSFKNKSYLTKIKLSVLRWDYLGPCTFWHLKKKKRKTITVLFFPFVLLHMRKRKLQEGLSCVISPSGQTGCRTDGCLVFKVFKSVVKIHTCLLDER